MTTPTKSGSRRTDQRALALHRNSFQAARRTGPLLRWSDLTPEVQGLLTQEFITNSAGAARWNVGQIYVETLHGWGVMCPHPMAHRLYEGWRASDDPMTFEEAQWFSCGLCKTRVVNRDA